MRFGNKDALTLLSDCCILPKQSQNCSINSGRIREGDTYEPFKSDSARAVFSLILLLKTAVRAEHKCHSLLFSSLLLWNFIWSRCLYDQTCSLHASVWQPGNTALARKQHESLRKHVPRRGDDWQRAAFSNSISLLPPAAEVGAAWRQVVTLSFLPSKSRGHDGDLPAPLPPAKHVASPQRPGWLGATQVLCAQLPC